MRDLSLSKGQVAKGRNAQEETRGTEVGGDDGTREHEVVSRLAESMRRYFPQFVEETGDGATALVREAFRWADSQYGLETARRWANGYKIPASVVAEDVQRLKAAGGCLVTMVAKSRDGRQGVRLSPRRVRAMLSRVNPEWSTIMSFASRGVDVLRSEQFVASGVEGRPPLRAKLVSAGGAVEKMIVESFRKQGLVSLLPMEVVRGLPPQHQTINFFTSSHANKTASEKGRTVGDLGSCGTGSGLNSDEVKVIADNTWGRIENPTLTGIVNMILRFWDMVVARDPNAMWSKVYLWKMDLSGAFTLLDFNPMDVPLLGTELQGNIVAFFECGLFGWTCMPAAFQVLNRAIKWELSRPGVLHGLMDMYTDDMIGVTLEISLERDMDAARRLCTGLLGPTAVEEKKTEWGRRLTIIGWDIDLDQRLVSIARRNALKAFYGFAAVDVSRKVPMTTIQRWSSWAERYGEICMFMRPFRRVLYNLVRGKLQHQLVTITAKAQRVVRLYQALLALSLLKEQSFTRSLSSFTSTIPTLTIQFDGSLWGSGVTWYRSTDRTTSALVGGLSLCLRRLDFGSDPAFQNCAEFISVTAGVIGAIMMGLDVSSVLLKGDSVTALSWAEGGRFKSDNVMNAATVFTMVCVIHGVHVVGTELVTSEENWMCDGLSRREPGESWVALMKRMGLENPVFTSLTEINLDGMESVIDLCNPKLEWNDEEKFAVYWRRVYDRIMCL